MLQAGKNPFKQQLYSHCVDLIILHCQEWEYIYIGFT